MSEKERSYTWEDPMPHIEKGMGLSGLDYMQKMIAGEMPPPPISQTMGFELSEVKEGRAVFTCIPADYHLNPLGTIHGGLACTLLDSAMSCAVHTTLPQGWLIQLCRSTSILLVRFALIRASYIVKVASFMQDDRWQPQKAHYAMKIVKSMHMGQRLV